MTDKPRRNRLTIFNSTGTEIIPGIWADPISEARGDYDGALAAYEASLMQIKASNDALQNNSLDAVFDMAVDLCATVASDYSTDPLCGQIAIAIRKLKQRKG